MKVICVATVVGVDHGVCLKAEFLLYTILSNEHDKFYTTITDSFFSRSVCFSMRSPSWWRFALCSSGSSLVFPGEWWRDASLVCEFQMWSRVNKQICIDFRDVKCLFWWLWSAISWKHFIIYSVRLFSSSDCNWNTHACYFQHLAGVDSILKENIFHCYSSFFLTEKHFNSHL